MNYYTSDPHFGCDFIKTRESILDVILIDLMNKLNKQDRLWILGDFSATGKVAFWRNKIKVKDVRFIVGNHDKIGECNKVFKHCYEQRTWKFKDGTTCFLSHYPCCYWNKSHSGAFHLYGHVHSNREETLNKVFPDRRSMDVCPENYKKIFGEYGLFSEQQIIELLGKKEGHDKVSYYENYNERSVPNIYFDFGSAPK